MSTAASIDAKVRANNASPQAFGAGVAAVVTGWTELFDLLGNFAPATGVFTAPTTGYYSIDVGVGLTAVSVLNATFTLRVRVAGATVMEQSISDAVAELDIVRGLHVSGDVQATVGQTIDIEVLTSIAATLHVTAVRNYLTIFQVP